MQPTTNTFDSMRTQVPDYSKVFGTQDLPKSTQPVPPHNSGKVDKTPTQDTLEIGNKSKMSKGKKALLALGTVVTAVVGAIVTHKAINAHQMNKALKAIDTKFADLETRLTEVQKTFKEVFMRDDLTEKETLEILKKYRDIEKLGVTGTKEEYINAMSEHAINNYNLKGIAKIWTTDKILLGDERILGYTNPLCGVEIQSKIDKKDILEVIHHELRHAKQRYYAFNYADEEYVKFNQPQNGKLSAVDFAICLGGIPDRSKIPSKYIEFAKKSIEGMSEYKAVKDDTSNYLAQWLETDAYSTGRKMKNLLQ